MSSSEKTRNQIKFDRLKKEKEKEFHRAKKETITRKSDRI